MLNRSFWRGRKVFLTGHTGFKGSWLSLWLDALGANVTGYALDPPTQPSLFEQANLAGSRPLNLRGHSRLPATQDCDSRVPPRCGYSHGRAVGRASRLRGSHRNLFLQRHGDRSCSGGPAAAKTAVRSGQCHKRQVLLEPRVGLGISRERADGWSGSIFEFEGLCRACDHGLPGVVLPSRVCSIGMALPLPALAPGMLSEVAIGPAINSFLTS